MSSTNKIVAFFFLVIFFWLLSVYSVAADCSDPNCRTLGAPQHSCGTSSSTQCISGSGGTHLGIAPGSGAPCAALCDGAGCGSPGGPECSNPYCTFQTVFSAECEGCCWGIGNGGTDYNGVVLAEDTGGTTYVKPAVQVSPSSGTRKWQVGHFDIKDADAGSNSITLSQLAPGYDDCSWSIWNYSTGAPTGESGDTCTATFDLPSSDWKRRVDFTMHRLLACAQNLSATCGDDGNTATFSWDPVPNAAEYVLRINHEPFDDWFNGAGGDQWLLRSGTTNQEVIDCDADYQWSVQGVRDGEEYPFSGCGQAGPEFNCPCVREAWWQVIDGDIATNGGLVSLISQDCVESAICQGFLDLAGPGGFPGIPSYLGTAGFGAGAVSGPDWKWIAESETVPSRVYDYAYFENLIPSDIPVGELDGVVNSGTFASGQAGPRGYHWYRWDGDANGGQGDLTLNDAISIGTIASGKGNKVILLVKNANLNIKATINIQIDRRGESFFMVIVEGDINIDPTEVADFSLPPDGLPELEGLFLAQESINTGSLGESNVDGQLHVRGSMATTNGAINLERDLIDGNAENPAELFEYAPDFLLTFPRELTSKRLRWKEVAP